jgi:hypothetical protein
MAQSELTSSYTVAKQGEPKGREEAVAAHSTPPLFRNPLTPHFLQRATLVLLALRSQAGEPLGLGERVDRLPLVSGGFARVRTSPCRRCR